MTESTTLHFPTPTLTKIDGEPTFRTLQQLQSELNNNAIAIESNRGSGIHGHLILTVTPATYLMMTEEEFDIPPNPGTAPAHVARASQFDITEANRKHQEARTEYRLFKRVGQALKSQLLAAIDHDYIYDLRHPTVAFANTTVLEMLTHLHTTYGNITTDQLDTNLGDLERAWNPDESIETLWRRVTDCRRFAADGGDPISERTAVRKTLAVIEQTGVFATAIEDWRKRPSAQWTWTNFREDFTAANRERVRKLTAAGGGYHSAATVAPPTLPVPATANTATNVPTPAPPTNATKPELHYCWSHGLGRNRAHTSATCNNKAPGHQDNADQWNMMGGNNTIVRRRNERPVYQPS